MKEEKLLPCPLCNGEVVLEEIPPHKHILVDLPDYNGGAIIECKCGCSIMRETKEEVIQAWNCRVQDDYIKIIDKAIETAAKTFCIGCAYLNLNDYKCTYNGSNCGVSSPMLRSVVGALEKLKEKEKLDGRFNQQTSSREGN